MEKEKLVEMIENTELEKLPGEKDIWEKHIFLEKDKVLIVGYQQEESFSEIETTEENINTYYWYWELRNSATWETLYANHDKEYSFCESLVEVSDDMGDVDRIGDSDLSDICTWSDQDWIEDISEIIAEEVIKWLRLINN